MTIKVQSAILAKTYTKYLIPTLINKFIRKKSMSLLKLFFLFFILSSTSIGGGYALVSMLEIYLLKRDIMTEKEFYTILSKAQSIPGPVAFTIALLIGKRLNGLSGGIISGIAVIIPPFISILLLFYILDLFKNNPWLIKFLKGIYGALIGLVGGVLYKMIKNQKWNPYKIGLFLLAFFGIILKHDLLFPIFGLIIIINYFLISKVKI